jgi:SAM-dependent MidA family methyltransferase
MSATETATAPQAEATTRRFRVFRYKRGDAESRFDGFDVPVDPRTTVLEALRWIQRIARHLHRGFVFTIDYGYTARESIRFPHGTLMSYRRHQALEDVLADPGERDITAHVPFTALEEHGKLCGLGTVRFESLARTLLDAGETDNFAAALNAASDDEQARRRLQLKTLLFGMGETFRTLIQRVVGGHTGR